MNLPHAGAMMYLELLEAAKKELADARVAMKRGDPYSEQRWADAVGALDELQRRFPWHAAGLGQERA